MFRRARIQSAMDVAIAEARKSDTFAGAYLDQQNGGRPVFLFTVLEPGVSARLAGLLPEGSDVQVGQASKTEREIAQLQERVVAEHEALARAGIDVIRVAIREDSNTIRIGVHDLTATAEKELKSRYGADAVVFEASVAQSDACAGGSNDCRPMKGGLAINHDGGQVGECTSGFVIRRTDSGALGLLTAGHCIQVHGGFDETWRHNSIAFGHALYETWVPGGSGNADVGLIDLFSGEEAQMTAKNRVRRTNQGEASVTVVSAPVLHGQACRIGVTSGQDCGMITDTDDANWSAVQGWQSMNVLHTAVFDKDSLGGDSGGPVIFYPGGGSCCSPVTALGTHVHSGTVAESTSWFSPYSWGRSAYSDLFPGGQTYNICLTPSC